MSKSWIIFICSLLQANNLITIKSGDTFNKLLREHHVAQNSIHLINKNAHQLSPLATLVPNDTLHITKNEQNNKLLSAVIHTKKGSYVLNWEGQSYQIHPLKNMPDIDTISITTEETSHNPLKVRAQRAASLFFPNEKGQIYAAFKSNTLVSIKLQSAQKSLYAFLNDDGEHLPTYQLASESIPALVRTPTVYKRISSPFDPNRLHPISKKILPHKGVDLAAPMNTPVWAAADGKVIHKSSDTGYGNMLIIEHRDGIQTYYAHLNKFHSNIRVGSTISQFETIGYVGSTGHSTGPHLHFETRLHGTPYDPLTFKPQITKHANTSFDYYF